MPTNIEMQHRPAPCNYERNTRLYRIEENKRHNRTFDTFTYLDLVGNGAVIAVVVMGLDDVPVLLASRRGAVRGASTGLENRKGLHHGFRIGAVHRKVELFGQAGAGFGVVVVVVVVVIGGGAKDRLGLEEVRGEGEKSKGRGGELHGDSDVYYVVMNELSRVMSNETPLALHRKTIGAGGRPLDHFRASCSAFCVCLCAQDICQKSLKMAMMAPSCHLQPLATTHIFFFCKKKINPFFVRFPTHIVS